MKKLILTIFTPIFIFSQEIKEEIINLNIDTSGYLENQLSLARFVNIPGVPEDDTAQSTVNAEMNVNNSGALIYSVPIEVLKGINNFQPNLAITYNSQSGNGQAGWGWNIAGISVITQGGTSKEIDGITKNTSFSSADPFYLDGQRLINTGENTFETLIYSKLKISKNSNGFSFVVNYPDGKIGKYKELASGQHYISVFTDALNNEIHYNYSLSGNLVYLQSISYGGTSSETDTFKINFNFKNRNYPIKFFKNGKEFINNKVLSQVIISSTYDGLYRKYFLTHDTSSSQNERLRAIEVENKEGDRLKPLKFAYNTSNFIQISKKDFPNNGLSIPNIKTLGNAVTGNFHNSDTPTPVYHVETNSGYKILDSKTGTAVNMSTHDNMQLFSGKTLINNSLTQNDQLIAVSSVFALEDYKNGFYTPNIKINITVKDLPTGKTRNVHFFAHGHYEQDLHPQDNECSRNFPDCTSYYRSKEIGEVVIADFNNDGLSDILIKNEISSCNVQAGGRPYRIKGLTVQKSNPVYYFIEIGKILTDGAITPEIFNSINGGELGTPIEFDGDGIPELGKVYGERQHFTNAVGSGSVLVTKVKVTKVNTVAKTLTKIDIGDISISARGHKNLFWGDFNGDGLTDFIAPSSSYYLNDDGRNSRSAQEVMNSIDNDNLTWNLFTSTGKGFIHRELNMTGQKLAYISPSEKNIIKKASGWDKFWSGKGNKYQYTEYGASYILPIDFDNDGKTDLVSIRKFTKLKQNGDYLNDLNIDNLNLSSPNSDIITFHKSVADKNGNISFVKYNSSINLKNTRISPLSMLITTVDQNPKLNSYQSGFIIHDPATRNDINVTIDTRSFNENYIQSVDNGSQIIQKIDYRPMNENNNSNSGSEKVYTTSSLQLKYPYYLYKSQDNLFLVHKINTLFDGKSLTGEYRYENGIQHLEGKGFIGFEKTFISDSYESVISKNAYIPKDNSSPVFWKVNIFDPFLDNSLLETTYGGLSYTDNKSVFSRNTTVYKKYDKDKHRYLILPVQENSHDYLKNTYFEKTFTYDANSLLLTKVSTDYKDTDASMQTTLFSYAPDFSNGEHFFSGKINGTEEISYRNGDSFSTKSESFFAANGLVSHSKKYGNNTQPVLTEYTYDIFGNLLSESFSVDGTEPLTSHYEYDATQRYVTKTISPEGLVNTQVVNSLGQVISETSHLGLTNKYGYTSWGNLEETIDYLENSTYILTDESPNGEYEISTQKDIETPSSEVFDKFNRKIRTKTRALGRWIFTDTQYDIFGKVIRTSEPYFEGETPLWNTVEYDFLSRPVKQTLYTGRVISTCYEGLKVTVEDGNKKSSKTLDVLGNIIEHRDSGGKIKYSYFPNGSVKETDYEGILIKSEQDGWGNRTKLVDPSAGTYLYKYDDMNRLIRETSPNGKTSYVYDRFGKLLREKTEGKHTDMVKSFNYDTQTLLLTSVEGTSSGENYRYETFYDQYYRVKGTKETTPYLVNQTESEFDAKGRLLTSTNKVYIPEINHTTISKVKNTYNYWEGLLIKQENAMDNSLIWELKDVNARGEITRMNFGNGYTVENQYDPYFFLQSIRHKKGNSSAVDLEYKYNKEKGLLTDRENKVFNSLESFTYDALDRLLEEAVNNLKSKEYNYDRRGRMVFNSEAGKYEYPEHNFRLNKITFNEKGLTINDRGFHEISYNAFKNPNEILLKDKDRLQYEYGIMKQRAAVFYGNTEVAKENKPNRKYYSANGSAEIRKEGKLWKVFSYVNGDAYSADYIRIETLENGSKTGDKNYFVHRDNQQSIIALTDAKTGAIAEQRYFDAWGNLTALKNEKGVLVTQHPALQLIDRGYTGHEHLQSVELIHMNGRMYDPVLRRFLSPDNFVQEPYNTQNYNRYSYVLNNPLLYTDPSGEVFLEAVIIGAAVGVLTNGINNQLNRVPFWNGAGKSLTLGAVSGAISFGIGSATSTISSSMTKALAQAGMHGASGGIMSSIDGGNFLSGFASGAVSSLVSSGVGKFGIDKSGNISKFGESSTYKAVMIASGGLSGGISSSIAGGSFWAGARQGVITSGLNHLAHLVTSKKSYLNLNLEDIQKGDPEFFEKLRQHYESKTGETLNLTNEEFQYLMKTAINERLIDYSSKSCKNGQCSAIVNFYKSSSNDLKLSFGKATVNFYYDKNGYPHLNGFYDKYDFDAKPWGVRSRLNEIITRAYNIYSNGKAFKIKYP